MIMASGIVRDLSRTIRELFVTSADLIAPNVFTMHDIEFPSTSPGLSKGRDMLCWLLLIARGGVRYDRIGRPFLPFPERK